ncbi:three-helix bundle dimerization domain-containing protein [Phytohabitans houttuyneae]|jgi:hypothetical protein|uniref:Protein-tyrosine-phosphatase-like N-terminal domain-containing protein n=1 Tax=Phytohabitans houttuyneae TaxID=1076126 RepID=A0A6V8KBZ3_9ACTN|nr:hypothetical protein [Phytohabitans houttuyneae]GFJ80950.1 hypothetical protein Phou_051300 [Phytohabitans houttuyneae]
MPAALLMSQERERLLARLTARYAGIRSPERVREVVDEVYARFAGARIQTYVPVLAEHAARELLDDHGRDGGIP